MWWTDPDGTMHEVCMVQFFLRGSLFGECSFDAAEAQDLSWRWSSAAPVCSLCGEVWGRIVLRRGHKEAICFGPFLVSCEQHPDRWNIPGSFLEPQHDSLIEYLPEQVLKRELQLLLRDRDKEIYHEKEAQTSPPAGAGVNPGPGASPG